MYRFRLLGIALIAVFALGAIASGAAMAENPEILPAPTEKAPLKFTSTGGLSTLVVMKHPATTIKCEKLTNKGEFTSADLGKVTIDFLNCKNGATIKCWSVGDEASNLKKETILVDNADIHIVDILPGGVLTPGAAVILLNTIVVECQGGVKIEIKGTVIGQLEKADGTALVSGAGVKELDLLFNLSVDKEEKGKPEEKLQVITLCDLLKAFCFETIEKKEVQKTFELSSNFGEGFEPSGEESTDLIALEKEAAIDF